MTLLQENAEAPEFMLPDQDGKSVRLSDFRGQYVLVYFYPKDDTPGCTKEACGIRDNYAKFGEMNVKVFGVSKDDPESHRKFIAKFNLPFTLLSDESQEMMHAYGAGVEGTKRISYLIDPAGMVKKVYAKVDVTTHAEQILGDVV